MENSKEQVNQLPKPIITITLVDGKITQQISINLDDIQIVPLGCASND